MDEPIPYDSILFLDVDGVLNCCGRNQGLEADKVELLKSIVNNTNCGIVISSTWRWMPEKMKHLESMCRDIGANLIGATPVLNRKTESGLYLSSPRSVEVEAWLEENPAITNFVILDDNADMENIQSHFVQTDSFTGLTLAIAEIVIEKLNQ